MKVLLQVRGVEKRYGSFSVLHDATAAFGEGMKVGVMGRNGAGKSTLCRILIGDEEPDAGEVIRARDLRLGYLAQHDPWEPGESVLSFLLRQTELDEWIVGRAAARFALKGEVMEKAVDSLPGGFRTRVKLSAMIAADPEFLVLDEPTNFLDLSTLLLLQEFLAEYRGAALIVSHDREFLKRTCTHTLEVEHGELVLFPGDLEAWFEEKEKRLELAARTNAAITAKKEQLQDFINRFGAKATKATQAKSKAKEMARLNTIEIRHPLATARIRIPRTDDRKGNAFVLDGLSIGYPGRRVASDIHFTVERGARMAIVGDNGQGKTTFLRTLAGDLEPLSGSIKRGHGVEVAVYAQHVYENLDPEDTVLSHLEKGAPFSQTRQDALEMAGCFLFSGEAVHKPVSVLSGGERARLCLAGLLLQAKPVLLLDEPPNHLDFATVAALGDALRTFNGTVLCISHDRTFVSMIEAEIIEVGAGHVRRRAGDYGDYVDALERRVRASIGAGGSGEKKEGKGAADWAESKRLRSERAKARNGLAKADQRMKALEAERDRLAQALVANPADAGLYRTLHEREIDLRKAEEEWLGFQAKVEELGE